MRKNKPRVIRENIAVTDYAAEGKAIARHEGKVIFVSGAVPGDVADLLLTKNKKDWAEARVLRLVSPSPDRVEPFCQHFGICGGCKWQMLPYEKQLQYKQQEAEQNLLRIGKITGAVMLPIAGADDQRGYRNKLEFTFSNKEYFAAPPVAEGNPPLGGGGALGYHAPRIFDKTINIFTCFLMDEVNNRIRNTVRDFAIDNHMPFYDIKEHTGWLRNLVVRKCTTGGLMVNLCINYTDEINTKKLLDHLLVKVPEITTLLYTVNPKWNDTIYDLIPQVYFGKGYVTERLENFDFIISPKSFFQTNTKQAEKLYGITRSFAQLTGNEVVYDLYCGTGSIGIFLSPGAKKIIGVELVEDAIADAKLNALNNKISNSLFFAGDVIKVCNDAFFAEHGKPDVVITDPPRAGMHEKLVHKLLQTEAPVIVYVSCNTATMARDILLLSEKYTVEKTQPVDMFPHTHHIECVARLVLKSRDNNYHLPEAVII